MHLPSLPLAPPVLCCAVPAGFQGAANGLRLIYMQPGWDTCRPSSPSNDAAQEHRRNTTRGQIDQRHHGSSIWHSLHFVETFPTVRLRCCGCALGLTVTALSQVRTDEFDPTRTSRRMFPVSRTRSRCVCVSWQALRFTDGMMDSDEGPKKRDLLRPNMAPHTNHTQLGLGRNRPGYTVPFKYRISLPCLQC